MRMDEMTSPVTATSQAIRHFEFRVSFAIDDMGALAGLKS